MPTSVRASLWAFWLRQFDARHTPHLLAFDLFFGIAAPILCFLFDPFVFTASRYNLIPSPLAPYRVFASVGTILAGLALAVWLTAGAPAPNGSGFFVGIFAFSALFAAGIGLFLLPIVLLGCLIGAWGSVLGLIPFLTAFVYLRNGVGAFRRSRPSRQASRVLTFAGSVALGLACLLTLPLATQWQTSELVSRSVNGILHESAEVAEQSTQRLAGAFWCSAACYDDIVAAYVRETDPARRAILAKAYRRLTEADIEFVVRSRILD